MTIIVDLSGGGTGGGWYWDRDISGDPFLEPHNAGDDLNMGSGSGTFGEGEDSVLEATNSSDVSRAKMNSNGPGYHMDNFGLGTSTPQAQLDLQGSLVEGRTVVANDTDHDVGANDLHMESFPITKDVNENLPSIASTATDRVLIFTNHGGGAFNTLINTDGTDTFYDTTTSFSLTNGNTVRLKNFGTYWDFV